MTSDVSLVLNAFFEISAICLYEAIYAYDIECNQVNKSSEDLNILSLLLILLFKCNKFKKSKIN